MATSTDAGGGGTDGATDREHEIRLHAVERFALLLTEGGMPRMPSRVFAYFLIGEGDAHTAGELAASLHVSPAAISGAVRYLVEAGLLRRERLPGARSDQYRLHGDLWYETYLQRIGLLRRWESALAETIDLIGPDRAGRSLRETHAFMVFLREEFPHMLERWRQRRDALS